MKYCKKCGVLYSDELAACPKCGAFPQDRTEEPPPEASRSETIRRWTAICIGIPAFICFLYLIGWLFAKLSGRL